jgi:hypothetical protein
VYLALRSPQPTIIGLEVPKRRLVVLLRVRVSLESMGIGRLLFFGACLILTSCCEEGERYPPLDEDEIDIVGNWELLGAKGEIWLSADRSRKFLITNKQIEIRGTFRVNGISIKQHGYIETSRDEKCLSYIFEWEEDEDESDPFSGGRNPMRWSFGG